jgi:hypothetical protein
MPLAKTSLCLNVPVTRFFLVAFENDKFRWLALSR